VSIFGGMVKKMRIDIQSDFFRCQDLALEKQFSNKKKT
jgi:hypothetical protein